MGTPFTQTIFRRGIAYIYSNTKRGLFKLGYAKEQPQNLSSLAHQWLVSFWCKAHCKPSLIFRAILLYTQSTLKAVPYAETTKSGTHRHLDDH